MLFFIITVMMVNMPVGIFGFGAKMREALPTNTLARMIMENIYFSQYQHLLIKHKSTLLFVQEDGQHKLVILMFNTLTLNSKVIMPITYTLLIWMKRSTLVLKRLQPVVF